MSVIGAVTRSINNPILTPDDVPYPVATVHNAAATRLDDGRTVLLFRSHTANGRSIIGYADSSDGEHFTVRPEPFLTPATDEPFATYERFGVEDPRLTRLDDGAWYFTYSAYSGPTPSSPRGPSGCPDRPTSSTGGDPNWSSPLRPITGRAGRSVLGRHPSGQMLDGCMSSTAFTQRWEATCIGSASRSTT